MGLLKSSIYFTPLSTSSIPVSLFDLESRFFAPTHTRVEADAHRACQGRPSLCPGRTLRLSRPRLDRPEHGGQAPRRRTHSRNRFQNHGLLRVTATSDRHRTLTMFCSSASESLSF